MSRLETNTGINPMLKTEGELFINGEKFAQAKKVLIKVSLNNSTSKPLGVKTEKTRTTGYKISVEVGMYKTNKFGVSIVKNYLDKGLTPEFTIQALNNDKGSDFFKQFGNDVVTITGCVPTGDLTLLDLDSSSTDYVEETINFSGYQFV